MTRKSFLIRKYESDSGPASSGSASVFGSYLKYPTGSAAASVGLIVKADEDTQLRSDELATEPILSSPTVPGNLTPTIAFFESQVLDYSELKLTWDLQLTSTLTTTPAPTRVLIVYSNIGEPQTVSDGLILVDTNTSSELTHYPPSGAWAYYSMFLMYETISGVQYYDRVSSLSELMPYDYKCSDDMYSKIPEYYRTLDSAYDTGLGGPLKRMISLFGFEADRMRTAIDYLISCKDPLLAHSKVLDVIAKDLTVNIRSEELGTAKLRNLLDSVGLIRRSLGTPASIALIVQAATGSEAAFNLTGASPKIDIYAQRVNYLKDPRFTGAAGSFSAGYVNTLFFSDTYDAGGASVPSVSATYEGGSPSSTFTQADEEQYWLYTSDPASGGSLSYIKTIDNKIPVLSGESLYFSIHGDFTENAQDEVVRVALYEVGTGAASAGYTGQVGNILISQSSSPKIISGIKYWQLDIPEAETPVWRNASITVFVPSTTNVSKGFQKLLLEKILGGSYFDGDSTNGGWVINYATGDKVSDYRWYNPSSPSSDTEGIALENYSVYNSNYKKTKALAERYLSQVLPVRQISSSSTVYSNAPDSVSTPIWGLNWNVIKGLDNV